MVAHQMHSPKDPAEAAMAAKWPAVGPIKRAGLETGRLDYDYFLLLLVCWASSDPTGT